MAKPKGHFDPEREPPSGGDYPLFPEEPPLPRSTSREAWADLQRSGRLGDKQMEALAIVKDHGPCTGQELQKFASSPSLWKRLSELRRKGHVIEHSKRRCSVTGRKAITWVAAETSTSDVLAAS
jgi:hypothetical protein